MLTAKWDLEDEVELGTNRALIYEGGESLGKGATSVVFPCIMREMRSGVVTTQHVAVKCEHALWEVDEKLIEEQMEIHKRIGKYDHENVMATLAVKVLEPDMSRFSVLSVSERMDGDLDRLIFKDEEFAEGCTYRDILEVLKQVCRGLDDLHSRNIIHHDLKPANVLYSRKWERLVVKLTDFGFSKAIREGFSGVTGSKRGTPEYMAPEISAVGPFPDKNFRLTKAIDIYSVGVMMWVMLNRKKPQDSAQPSASTSGQEIVWPTIINKKRRVWCNAPPALCDLVESCLSFPQLEFNSCYYNRPSIKTILETILSMEKEAWAKERAYAYTQVDRDSGRSTSSTQGGSSSRMTKPLNMGKLHEAAVTGDYKTVKALIKAGAEVEALDGNHRTALLIAARYGHAEIIRILIEAGAAVKVVGKTGLSALHIAAGCGHIDATIALIEAGADPNLKDKSGNNAIHCAAKYGRSEAIRALIKAGGDVNTIDKDCYISLHIAVKSGHIEATRALIEGGAQVNEVGKGGWSSLHLAANKGHAQVARVLIEAGAEVDGMDNDGRSALYLAVRSDHIEATRALIRGGADVNLSGASGLHALHLAAERGYTDIVHVLITAGADVSVVDGKGDVPLHLAARQGRDEALRTLIAAGANVNMLEGKGYSALFLAARYGYVESTRALVNGGADLIIGDESNRSPLNIAATYGHTEAAKLLIEAGASIDLQDIRGYAPLHAAAQHGRLEVARALLDAGASLDLRNGGHHTPLETARTMMQWDLVHLLR